MQNLDALKSLESTLGAVIFLLNPLVAAAKFLFLTPWGWIAIGIAFIFVVIVGSRGQDGEFHLSTFLASLARTAFSLYANLFHILVGVAILAGVYVLSNAARDAAATLTLMRETKMLEAALANLKSDRKVLEVKCVPDMQDPGNNLVTLSYFAWSPGLDRDVPAGEETVTIAGEKIYVDFGVINFDYSLVEKGERKNITFPHTLYSDIRAYENGADLLHPSNGVPASFSPDRQTLFLLDGSEYDREIGIVMDAATNRDKARKLGIRAAYGEAIAIKPQQNGKTYQFYSTGTGGVVLKNPD
jgi:hypothetical protein